MMRVYIVKTLSFHRSMRKHRDLIFATLLQLPIGPKLCRDETMTFPNITVNNVNNSSLAKVESEQHHYGTSPEPSVIIARSCSSVTNAQRIARSMTPTMALANITLSLHLSVTMKT